MEGKQRPREARKTTRSDDLQSLRRCILDLGALSGLSSAWHGHEPSAIAGSLAQVLQHTLALDFTYVRLKGQGSAVEASYTQQGLAGMKRTRMIGQMLAPCLNSNGLAGISSIADPSAPGTLRVFPFPIGCAGACGVLVATSRRRDFPTDTERALLGIAANQAVIVLQQRQTEQAIHEREARFRALVEASAQIVWTTDRTGAMVDDSPSWRAFTAQTHEQQSGWGWLNALHPEEREPTREHWQQLLGQQRPCTAEYGLRRADGNYRHMAVRAVPVFNPDGSLREWVGMASDVTEHKLAEMAQRQLAAIVESSHDAIISKTLEGVITSWNKGAEHIFGYTAGEVLGQPITLLVPPERRDEELQIIERLKRGERIEHFDTVGVRKDGQWIDISVTISPVRDGTGLLGASKVARDITDRKRTEEERARLLARAQSAREQAEAATLAKDELIALVSHELRSPLNAIHGWVQVLASQDTPEPVMVRKAIGAVSRAVEQQRCLIDDLLDIARMTSGKLKLELKALDLIPIAREALEVARPTTEIKGITLFSPIDLKSAPVTGDVHRLQQVIANLLSNAVKFTPSGGRIELRLEHREAYVRIVVSDTGCGVAPDFLPNLFERFRQADSTSTRRYGGLGLGMALVKHIVELHGGEVRAESPGLGQGTCVTVDLPLRAMASPVPVEQASSPIENKVYVAPAVTPTAHSLDGVNALIVDDQDTGRDLVATMLQRCGAAVTTAGSVREALPLLQARFESQPLDVLICDIAMPGEDGYCLIRKLRAMESKRGMHAPRGIPAIALTALAQPEDRMQALQAGFQMHLAKPVDLAALVAAVRTLVARSPSDSR